MKALTSVRLPQFFIGILFSSLFFLFSINDIFARHIVGGEMTYECLGNNQYRIDLTVYRDAGSGGADFDDPAILFIFRNNEFQYIDAYDVALTFVDEVAPPQSICIETLPDVEITFAPYSKVITLPNQAGSYTVAYQRYSRNEAITNIINPGETGSTYAVTIPHDSGGGCTNDSPVFEELPPIVICANNELRINQSATDVDGDSLVYALCTPVLGGNMNCFRPAPFECDPTPPPFPQVAWRPPYTENNPIGGTVPLTIDPVTGVLTGFPTIKGQFVVGICVTDYRDGAPLSTVRRDFQFNVTDCKVTDAAVVSQNIAAGGEFILRNCSEGLTVDFNNISIGASNYIWNFGDPTATDAENISTEENPTFTYADVGTYNVTLVAEPGAECTDTAFIELIIYPILESNFNFEPVCAGNPTPFTDISTSTYGNIVEWFWDFGDPEASEIGNTSNLQNPTHIYTTGRNYPVSLIVKTDLGCVDTFGRAIVVNPAPVPNFTPNITCPESPVQFNNETSNANIVQTTTWDFGDGNTSTQLNPSHTYTEPGAYTVGLATVSNNGCQNVFTKTIVIYPPFEPSVTSPNIDGICEGESAVLVASPEANNIAYEYAWSSPELLNNPAIARPLATPTQSTTFTVTITDPNGCWKTTTINIPVNPTPILDLGNEQEICEGDVLVLEAQNIANNLASFEWSGENLTETDNLTPDITPLESATYYLSIVNQNGCTNNDSVQVIVVPTLEPMVENTEEEICEGDEIQLSASGGVTYEWSPTSDLSNPNIANPIASPLESTTYEVAISNTCFSETQTVNILVNGATSIDAGEDMEVNIGESVTLDASANGTFSWTPTAGLDEPTAINPIAQPIRTTTYYLSATSEAGCTTIDSVTVTVNKVFDFILPTAFSPNDDGINDEFRIIDTRGIESITDFRVYDRWGKKIFESTPEQIGWDGDFNNLEQEIGTYVYYITARTFEPRDTTIKGMITLFR